MDEQGDQPTAIHHSKLFVVGTPCNVADGPLLVKGDSDAVIKIASCTEKIHGRLSIVALVGVVDLGLGDHQGLRSEIVPFDLSTTCKRSLSTLEHRKGREDRKS